MKGAILRLGLYGYRFFRSWCAGGDVVMIQKSGAIVKAYNGEQSPLFVELRGADDFFQPLKFHLEPIDLWIRLEFCIERGAGDKACPSQYYPSLAGHCHALPHQAEPYPAPPCQAMPGAFRSTTQALPYHTSPNHTQPGLDFHALIRHTMPYRANPSQTMPYHGLFSFLDIRCSEPAEHTAFLRTPVPEPNLAAGNVQPLKQMALVDLLIIHIQFKRAGPGRIKLRPRA